MFHLTFPIPNSSDKISINDSIVSMGSCFADNIGQKLRDHKFNCLSNPFGTVYNPVSLSQLLDDAIDEKAILENSGVHYHWQCHGEVSALSQEDLRLIVKNRRQSLQEHLKTARWLILTLGSSLSYRLNASNQVVANCHKLPQSEFTKELLEIDQMTEVLSSVFQKLKAQNPSLKIILTVSPVRHIRDGLVENNRSKARLIEVAQGLSWQQDWIKYFPAYEILTDELRDYRFYAKDRVHPSEEAVEYIWKKFIETYFDENTIKFISEWSQIQRALNHRPFHSHSSEHQKFIKATLSKLERLGEQVNISEEVSLLKQQLI